jgi:hypothetical protein
LVDSKKYLLRVQEKAGTEYAISTNNIFEYNLETKKQKNHEETKVMTLHSFHQANLTWLQMKRDGYEADKNDTF